MDGGRAEQSWVSSLQLLNSHRGLQSSQAVPALGGDGGGQRLPQPLARHGTSPRSRYPIPGGLMGTQGVGSTAEKEKVGVSPSPSSRKMRKSQRDPPSVGSARHPPPGTPQGSAYPQGRDAKRGDVFGGATGGGQWGLLRRRVSHPHLQWQVRFWGYLGYERGLPLIHYMGRRVACNRGKARKTSACFQMPGDVMITGQPCAPAELRSNNVGNPPAPREEF